MEDTAKIEEFFKKHFPAFLEEKEEIAREEGRKEAINTIFQFLRIGLQEKKKGKTEEEIKARLKAEGASDEDAAWVVEVLS